MRRGSGLKGRGEQGGNTEPESYLPSVGGCTSSIADWWGHINSRNLACLQVEPRDVGRGLKED